jgi:hypothetical protein
MAKPPRRREQFPDKIRQVNVVLSSPVTAPQVTRSCARHPPPHSRRPSSTSIVSSYAYSCIYTMRTTRKSSTCTPNLTSTRSSPTSLDSATSTSCWTSKTFAVRPTRRLSGLALFGSVKEKWAFWNLDGNDVSRVSPSPSPSLSLAPNATPPPSLPPQNASSPSLSPHLPPRPLPLPKATSPLISLAPRWDLFLRGTCQVSNCHQQLHICLRL